MSEGSRTVEEGGGGREVREGRRGVRVSRVNIQGLLSHFCGCG